MYGLDVNFLKDREIRPVEATARARQAAAPGDRRPLFIGAAVAIAALGLLGVYWLFLLRDIEQLEAQENELEDQIGELQQQLDEIDTVRAQINAVRAENQAFANVFDEIRPWSALLQELRTLVPIRIQIVEIKQTVGETPQDDLEAEPSLAGGVEFSGIACSFSDVNDFVLELQRSPFFDGESVAIVEAKRPETIDDEAEIVQLPLVPDPRVFGNCPGTPEDVPEILVQFKIEGNLTTIPSSDLLEALDRQGAVGLSSRIRAIRDSGALAEPQDSGAAETSADTSEDSGAAETP